MPEPVAPQRAIHRFDVFAEYTRQERREQGAPEDEAKGDGIWLAKVGEPEPKFRAVGDKPQTDATFDHEIIDRMGSHFYAQVFVPAIAAARARGERYEGSADGDLN